jgi:large subunit ribosomal protein L36e
MTETNNRSGIFVGLNHGHVVNVSNKPWKTRPVTRRGRLSKRSRAVREIIREVAGFSPLEKKMLEWMKMDVPKDKKALKTAKAKLGTHRRALHKRDEITEIINLQRRKA